MCPRPPRAEPVSPAPETFTAPPSPYDFHLWYPLLRGALRLRGAVRIDHSPRGGTHPELWQDLAPGESRLLLDGGGAPALGRGLDALLRGSRLRVLAAGLPRGHRLERFFVLPGPEGGWVLLPAGPPRRWREGLALLPATRRRERLRRHLLAGGARVGSRSLPGAAQVALFTRGPLAPSAPQALVLGGALAGVSVAPRGRNRVTSLRLCGTRWLPPRLVKSSRDGVTRARVEAEAAGLERIEKLLGPGAAAPRLLGAGTWGDVAYVVQEAVRGAPTGAALDGSHLRFLGALRDATAERRPLEGVATWETDAVRFAHARVSSERAWCAAVQGLAHALRDFWGERTVPCALAHGDFTPWNLVRRGADVCALAWEDSAEGAGAGHDLFHFLVQTGVLLHGGGERYVLAALERALHGPARRLVGGESTAREEVWGAFGLYLHHALVRDEYARGLEDTPAPREDRLRRTRLSLARGVTARLRERLAAAASGGRAA